MFFDSCEIKLNINSKIIKGKFLNFWKLRNKFLNNYRLLNKI